MATLTAAQRRSIWRDLMATESALPASERQPLALTKAEYRAAVDAIDTWLHDNRVSFNNAIPEPARTALSGKQKARALLAIVVARMGIA